MIIHRFDSRGAADHGWLKSYHTFSFADYYDPRRMNFGALRVINDDFIAPGMGFGTHPHRDMEIITIPLSGALMHEDSMGTKSIISKGEVQIMSAGTGIFHSEFNASKVEPVTLLQIWVMPKNLHVAPRYEQKDFSSLLTSNEFTTVVAPDGINGAVSINQDAFFSIAKINQGKDLSYTPFRAQNLVYVFLISGKINLLNQTLFARDAAGLDKTENKFFLSALEASEVLVMEVPTYG